MENTNKTLALLLVAAIVVSLGGTMISLEKLGQISTTGKATTTGTSTINISSTYIVDLTDTTIDFGDGSLAEGVDNCKIYSQNGTESPAACWTGTVTDEKIEWENAGSSPMYVDVQINTTSEQYLGGDHDEFGFLCAVDSGTGYGWTQFAAAETNYDCADNVPATGSDNGSTWMYVNVSSGATAKSGERVATLSFSALAS